MRREKMHAAPLLSIATRERNNRTRKTRLLPVRYFSSRDLLNARSPRNPREVGPRQVSHVDIADVVAQRTGWLSSIAHARNLPCAALSFRYADNRYRGGSSFRGCLVQLLDLPLRSRSCFKTMKHHQAKADDIRQSRHHHCPLRMSEVAPPVPDPGAVFGMLIDELSGNVWDVKSGSVPLVSVSGGEVHGCGMSMQDTR
jgi:hypothetical protein